MKLRRIAPVVLGCIALTSLPAIADTHPNAQWRLTETTFFDLIQNGYSIVGATSVSERVSGLPSDTYLLQKNNSVYRCVETRTGEPGTMRAAAPLRCAELVKPFAE